MTAEHSDDNEKVGKCKPPTHSRANPDMVERLATGAPLAEVDWTTVYASGPRGYSDYPAIRRAAAE